MCFDYGRLLRKLCAPVPSLPCAAVPFALLMAGHELPQTQEWLRRQAKVRLDDGWSTSQDNPVHQARQQAAQEALAKKNRKKSEKKRKKSQKSKKSGSYDLAQYNAAKMLTTEVLRTETTVNNPAYDDDGGNSNAGSNVLY